MTPEDPSSDAPETPDRTAGDGAGTWSGRRALVTGATGFIGRHLCRWLSARGAEVVAASRSAAQFASAIGSVASAAVDGSRSDPAPGVAADRLVALDVTDPVQCARVLDEHRPEVVFHLASRVTGSRDGELVLPMLHANLIGTVHLLAALHAAGRGGSFVQVGSQEEPRGAEESPASPYAAAKSAATIYCRLFAALYGVPVGVARVFMVYGPGHQDENKLVPYVIRCLLAGEPAKLMSGNRRIDWVFVDDVARGLARLAEALPREHAPGRRALEIELGSGALASVREVAERLAELLPEGPRPELGAVADRAGEIERRADLAAAAAIGWRPQVGLDEGLARTVEWFRGRSGG